MMSLNTSLIKCWKTVGAFLSPKGITRYSKCPNTQVNAVLYSWPFLIHIRLKAWRKSILENILPLRSLSNIKLISGMGKELR